MVDFCFYNQRKYTRVGCGSLRRNKIMRYGTGKLELGLCLCERVRRDVFIPNLCCISASRHLLSNFRSAVDMRRGRLPLTADEEQ